MISRRYFVFPDGNEWVVFAPVSRLVMRVNGEAAARFTGLVDMGSNASVARVGARVRQSALFPPADVTVVCTNRCAQRCAYCYGTPAHENASLLDPAFCRTALRLAAQTAVKSHGSLRVFFHGVGEPTFVWPLFEECVGIARQMKDEFGIPVFIRLCTGGQVSASHAAWIADRIDDVHVSLDGPRDIQNLQRPRRDGRDSYDLPLNLSRVAARRGKQVTVKATVTNSSVNRMGEITEFVAREIGKVRLDFGMMFSPPWVGSEVTPPPWQSYVTEFGKALSRGVRLGVRVQHPTISYETLCAANESRPVSHFCLVPPDIVTAFFDVPGEGSSDPELGAYGWYDATSGTVRFDDAKRRELQQGEPIAACSDCPCARACHGVAGVKGRFPHDLDPGGSVCLARIGVLKELLRHAVGTDDQVRGNAALNAVGSRHG